MMNLASTVAGFVDVMFLPSLLVAFLIIPVSIICLFIRRESVGKIFVALSFAAYYPSLGLAYLSFTPATDMSDRLCYYLWFFSMFFIAAALEWKGIKKASLRYLVCGIMPLLTAIFHRHIMNFLVEIF